MAKDSGSNFGGGQYAQPQNATEQVGTQSYGEYDIRNVAGLHDPRQFIQDLAVVLPTMDTPAAFPDWFHQCAQSLKLARSGTSNDVGTLCLGAPENGTVSMNWSRTGSGIITGSNK